MSDVVAGMTRPPPPPAEEDGSGGVGGGSGTAPGLGQGPYSAIIRSFVEELLDPQAAGTYTQANAQGGVGGSGGSGLVSRMIELLKDNSLEPSPTSRLPVIADEAGIPAGRALMLQVRMFRKGRS